MVKNYCVSWKIIPRDIEGERERDSTERERMRNLRDKTERGFVVQVLFAVDNICLMRALNCSSHAKIPWDHVPCSVVMLLEY